MNPALKQIRRIIQEEEARGLTQTEIANKVGLSQASIFKYLEQDVSPTLRTILQFSKAYNLSLSELTEGGVKELHLPDHYSKAEQDVIDRIIRIMRGKDKSKQNMLYSFLQMCFPSEVIERQARASAG